MALLGNGRVRTLLNPVGDLAQTPVSALLYKLFANQSTGVLTIGEESNRRVVYFLEGQPVHAESKQVSDSLGAILVREGSLHSREVSEALAEQKRGTRLEQILLAKGLLTPAELGAALARQVYIRVLHCFALRKGPYVFRLSDEWIAGTPHYPQNPIRLIVDGIREHVDRDEITERFADKLDKVLVRTPKFDHFAALVPVTEQERRWLELVDARRTLQQLGAVARERAMDFLTLVYALRSAGMVDFGEAPKPAEAPAAAERPPPPSRAAERPPPPSRATDEPLGGNSEVHDPSEPRPGPAPIDGPPPHVARDPAPPAADEAVPPPAPAAETAKDIEDLRRIVGDLYPRLGESTYWELLGIPYNASPAKVREAYQALRASLDGDGIAMLDPQARSQAERVAQTLAAARDTLVDPVARVRYNQRCRGAAGAQTHVKGSRVPGPAPAEARHHRALKILEMVSRPSDPGPHLAEGLPTSRDDYLERARRLVERRVWNGALEAIQQAMNLDPHHAEIVALHAWILFNIPLGAQGDEDRKLRVCRERLELALTLANDLPDTHYYAGRVAEAAGELKEAAERYRNALRLDRGHNGARTRLLAVRSAARARSGDPSRRGLKERLGLSKSPAKE